jgi:hypothetical protein
MMKCSDGGVTPGGSGTVGAALLDLGAGGGTVAVGRPVGVGRRVAVDVGWVVMSVAGVSTVRALPWPQAESSSTKIKRDIDVFFILTNPYSYTQPAN